MLYVYWRHGGGLVNLRCVNFFKRMTMLTIIKKKCMACGNRFTIEKGGVVAPIPSFLPSKCPKCGSRFTITQLF